MEDGTINTCITHSGGPIPKDSASLSIGGGNDIAMEHGHASGCSLRMQLLTALNQGGTTAELSPRPCVIAEMRGFL